VKKIVLVLTSVRFHKPLHTLDASADHRQGRLVIFDSNVLTVSANGRH